MRCIQLHSSLLPMHAKLKQHQHHHIGHTTKLSWLTSREPSRTITHSHLFNSLRAKALPDFIVAAASTPPAKSGDLSAFLPVSALLLSLYFISNFIVPEFISKSFGFDKLNEDQKVDDVSATEDK